MRAHAAGVVHRDIKPANLFLARRDGELVVQVLDFGVARVKEELAAKQNPTLTVTGVMLGTPLYMSPEQVVSGAKVLDHRTDLWSLAIVLYEALAGETPHADCETLGGLMVAICGKKAKPLRQLAPKVSEPEVEAIVMRALELDPAKRLSDRGVVLDSARAAVAVRHQARDVVTRLAHHVIGSCRGACFRGQIGDRLVE